MSNTQIFAHKTHQAWLNSSILQVEFQLTQAMPYKAGDYVMLHLAGKDLPFSIANMPKDPQKLSLQVRILPDSSYHQLLCDASADTPIAIKGPFEQYPPFPEDAKEIIMLAAGTGLSPMKAMIESWLAAGDPRPLWLYHGARLQSDLYMDATYKTLKTQVTHFHYHSCLSQEIGHQCEGYVQQLMLDHHGDLSHAAIYICGPWGMKGEVTQLVGKGRATPQWIF